MGLYHHHAPIADNTIIWEKSDLAGIESIEKQIRKFSPDIVIHSAAIAHQSLHEIDQKTYFEVNSIATEKIARIAFSANPDVQFIFLSSISVYGEHGLTIPVLESHACNPTSDYGKSKLDAENRLLNLFKAGQLKYLAIFRLAPVYDANWSFNLDRRVLAPLKLAYLKFGSGRQMMSALAQTNLVDWMEFWIETEQTRIQKPMIFNICDEKPYTFLEIIDIFLRSSGRKALPVISCPLFFIYAATRMAGQLFPGKREWLHSCYEKLALNLVFDSKKMLETGFVPVHNLETVFLSSG
jgi:nucleoside-diphosphate-sugar epimerase